MEVKSNEETVNYKETEDITNQLNLNNKILKSSLELSQKEHQNQLVVNRNIVNQLKKTKDESEEYKIQLENLQKTIELLQIESKDHFLKRAELEEKLKKYNEKDEELECNSNIIKENEKKIYELNVLLKESRKQNVVYSNQLNQLKRDECTFQQMDKEISYLQKENLTLKAFIIAQNKMSHYGNAFDKFNSEQFCAVCSRSLLEISDKINTSILQGNESKTESLVPEANNTSKEFHKDSDEYFRHSALLTTCINNKEISQKKTKESTASNTPFPQINKKIIKQMMDKFDLSTDEIDAIMKTVFHLGDQMEIIVESDPEKQVKATVKYIGNLDDRYGSNWFLGVKLIFKNNEESDIKNRNDGCFRRKRYFCIDSLNGYFIHFSNVVRIYDRETAQFKELSDFMSRILDPTINRNNKKH